MEDSRDDRAFREYVVAKLTELSTMMRGLVGDGTNPGRFSLLEAKVSKHDKLIWMAIGAGIAGGYILQNVARILSAH